MTGVSRRVRAPLAALGAAAVGLALAALVEGASAGPTWLLLVGLTATAGALTALGAVAEGGRDGEGAAGLRPGGPQAYAPALVHSVRVVHRDTGRLLLDPEHPGGVCVVDLTVVPEGRRPFRVEVRHSGDARGLRGLERQGRAVVRYDPRQPWRVALPGRADPVPPEWLARAERLDPAAVRPAQGPPRGLPPGLGVLAAGVLVAAVVLLVVHVVG
ncbi:hypothetical protein [Streptomyces sp. G45]|uniref:hypothetical protein n=1 Tax=Streptomyces sp. G45 TaxID=3406627 RepID=UPI003C18718A